MKFHVKDHEFFLNSVMNQPPIPHHSIFYQVSIGSSIEISDDILIKFCQKSDFLAVIRLLNTFKSQNHIKAAQQAVSCMDHHINLVLKAGQPKNDIVNSFKSTLLEPGASFGLTHFYADFIKQM